MPSLWQVVLIAVALLAGVAEASAAGEVRFTKGAVTLTRAGQAAPIKAGQTINAGDKLTTGKDGEVHILFIDKAVMSVRPNSEITVEKYRMDDTIAEAVFALARGTVRSVTGLIARKPKAYGIRTPIATVGVRGTDHEPYVLLPKQATQGDKPGVYNKVNRGESTLILDANEPEQVVAAGQVGFVRDFSPEVEAARKRGERFIPLLLPALLAAVPKFFVPAPNEAGFEKLAAEAGLSER